jgi:hypothetical protein
MSVSVQDIEALALSLPAEQRAQLLARLIASFDPKSKAHSAWMELARQRREEVRAGKALMATGAEAIARMKARLP